MLFSLLLAAAAAALAPTEGPRVASQADSLYLRAYTTPANDYHNGLHIDWSADGLTWFNIGDGHAFVKSDYGNWGPQKRMLNPCLTRLADGSWRLFFRVGERDQHIAIAISPDLVHWAPQDYYLPNEIADILPAQLTMQTHRVEQSVVQRLQDEVLRARAASAQNAERAADDLQGRFQTLQPVSTQITVSNEHTRQISDRLMGIFFEDISYAADGGLYGELVQNRDFEYNAMDRRNDDPTWTATTAWTSTGAMLSIGTSDPIHENNAHYGILTIEGEASLANCGWDGMAVKVGAKYDFSFYVRAIEAKANMKPIVVTLRSESGEVLARSFVSGAKSGAWRQLKTTLKATASSTNAHLQLDFVGDATLHLDMISLFPQDTYKGRKNGMRRDLAEALEAMHPQFVRFPGGCVAHGDGLDNLYRWKNTLGPLEARKPNWNIWRYHQTVGLGYYVYFQFCEDLGAQPLPVLAAAVPCQNSCVGPEPNNYGQQGGISIGPELDAYIQDILDLIEWANGDPKTSQWAKMRAEAGHPKPFGLKMVGIGNEDMITKVFEERFRLIYDAVHAKYPDIEVVGTAGPFFEGSDYEAGWRLGRELGVDYLDEHYYNSPGWFINNQQFYDSYQRGGTKVYLGEYAAHIPNRANNIETALAEALYLCSVERNGDVVEMTSYAPLFARKGHTSWNPDLIYFDSNEVCPTTGYEVQRLFGVHSGTEWFPTSVSVTIPEPADRHARRASQSDVQKRIGTSVLRDPKSGEYIIKLVNYLPVANTVKVSLPFLSSPALVSAEELAGALDALEVKTQPKEGVTVDGSVLSTTLAPYSFTVIRVK